MVPEVLLASAHRSLPRSYDMDVVTGAQDVICARKRFSCSNTALGSNIQGNESSSSQSNAIASAETLGWAQDMTRFQKFSVVLSVVCFFVAVLVLAGCQGVSAFSSGANPTPTPDPGATPTPTPGPSATPTPTPTPTLQTSINHVVMMLQENRSFDSYFGKMTAYRTANGVSGTVDDLDSGKFQNSGIAPYHSGSVCMENLSPDWAEDRHQVNLSNPRGIDPRNPKTMPMNGFVNTAAGISAFYQFIDVNGHRAMGYYTEHELNYYYFIATNFAMSDAFYSPAPTNTPNNRVYAFGATSQGTIHTPGGAESCPGERVQISSKPIFQVLSENNISWKIYITDLEPTCDPKGGAFPLNCAVLSTYLQFFTYIDGINLHPPVPGFNPD